MCSIEQQLILQKLLSIFNYKNNYQNTSEYNILTRARWSHSCMHANAKYNITFKHSVSVNAIDLLPLQIGSHSCPLQHSLANTPTPSTLTALICQSYSTKLTKAISNCSPFPIIAVRYIMYHLQRTYQQHNNTLNNLIRAATTLTTRYNRTHIKFSNFHLTLN